MPTKELVSREFGAMTSGHSPARSVACGCLCWSTIGHFAWSSQAFPWSCMVEFPAFLIAQLLSCDYGAESTDFLSSILPPHLTTSNLPRGKKKRTCRRLGKTFFPGHRKQRWSKSLICCPVEGRHPKGASQPASEGQRICDTGRATPKHSRHR